jgi:DNA polymerase I
VVTETAANNALLTDQDEIRERFTALVREARPVCIDFETGYRGEPREKASLHAEENFIVSLQVTNSPDWGRFIPLAFDAPPNADNKMVAALFWQLAHAVDAEGLPLMVAHNAFAELRWGARWLLRHLWDHPLFGRQVIAARGYFPMRSDTLLERYVEAESPELGLKPLTLAKYGHQMTEIEELFEDGLTEVKKKQIRFNTLDQHDPRVIAYACEDVIWGLRHHLDVFPRMRDDFIYRLEMQILPIVCAMTDRGLHVDWDYIREGARQAREFEQLMLADIIADFNKLLANAGHDQLPATFNFNSSQQRAQLFHDWLGLPVVHWTSGGKDGKNKKPSTDAKNAIPKLARLCPAVAKYAKWKKLLDLRVKFLDIYPDRYCWADDQFAHCSLNQFGTIAGRFSCEDFNYQQSVKDFRAELSDGSVFEFSLRSAIQAPPPGWRPWHELVLEEAGAPPELYPPEEGRELGWYILGFDYSQQELRVMASQAQCRRLIADYEAGADVHVRTAALMLGVPEDQVTKPQRAEGKTRNFANIFGQGPKALADQLGIPLEEAYLKDTQYRTLYPELKPYRERVIRQARRDGHLITKFGRKVAIHEYRDPNPNIRFKGDMTAGNAAIQGPATGDYPKIAMVRAQRVLERAGLADVVQMFMNVHDALEFAVRKDVPPALVIAVLKDAVVFPVKGWLPIVADWHMGTSWGTLKELTVLPDGSVCLKGHEPPGAVPPPPVAAPLLSAPHRVQARDFPRAAETEPVSPEGPPRKVIITVRQMPAAAEAQRLMALLRSMPGPNTVILSTPEGEVPVRGSSALAPGYQAQVAAVLSGAVVSYALDSVDAEALADGLRL